eukprot:scaffold99967_cov54-Phaeocystis_antarctica.AAC.1
MDAHNSFLDDHNSFLDDHNSFRWTTRWFLPFLPVAPKHTATTFRCCIDKMLALLAKKKTGAVSARPVEEPLLIAAVHDARRGAAVSTAALARGGWCEDVRSLTNAQ